MKVFVALLLLSVSALAQTSPVPQSDPSCGPPDIDFNVTLDRSKHMEPPPEPGMARVFFIKDDGDMGDSQHFVLKLGMDGEWIGAFKQNSFMTVSVEPGVHHVCVNVQSKFSRDVEALAHFKADEGKTYYFRTQFLAGLPSAYRNSGLIDLAAIDSDETRYLLTYFPVSEFHVKK
jgi:hypothetical protein